MKIVVDFDQCDSNGLCCEEAPELFELDENEYLVIINDTPTDEQVPAAERAAAACPKVAIELVE